jgi:hypothetical protein
LPPPYDGRTKNKFFGRGHEALSLFVLFKQLSIL